MIGEKTGKREVWKGRIIFVVFVLSFSLFALPVHSSETIDYQTVESQTYRLFLEQKWDSVIVIGKQALQENLDYFYLRLRIGISYYELQKYIQAIEHLRKAREFNSMDPVAIEYLYQSYVHSGRDGDANALIPGMSSTTKEKLQIDPDLLEQVHFESGYTISSDRDPENLATLMGSDSIYGEEDLYGNNLYSNLGLKLRLSHRVGLSMAYNYLNFNKTKYIQYGRSEAILDSIINKPFSKDYFYSYPWKIYDTSFKYQVKQHEGYLNASVIIPWGIKIIPAIHFLHVSYTAVNPSYRVDSISDTAYYFRPDSTYHMFRYPSVVYSFTEKDTSFNNWVVSLGLSRDFGIFNIGLNGSWSNLNGKNQEQVGASLTYYPMGTINYYGTTAATGFFQGKDKRLLLSQVIGAKITPWLWAEGNFYYGDYTNANIFNGSIVYNNTGIIDYRGGATLMFILGKHIRLSLIYQYFRKESQQLYYIKTGDPVTKEINEIQQTKNNPYNTNTIIGGITWKF
jgi:tetratricopeptide (TPR) repeat protein